MQILFIIIFALLTSCDQGSETDEYPANASQAKLEKDDSHKSALEEHCEEYASKYTGMLGLTAGGSRVIRNREGSLHLTKDDLTSIAYQYCMNYQQIDGGGSKGDLPAKTIKQADESISNANGEQVEELIDDTPMPLENLGKGFKEPRGVFEFAKPEIQKRVKAAESPGVAAAIETGLRPLMGVLVPGLGLHNHEPNFGLTDLHALRFHKEVPEKIPGLSLSDSHSPMSGFKEYIRKGLHGVGAGISIGGSAGFGAQVGGSFAIELIHHHSSYEGNENRSEIGLYCSAGPSIGRGFGASAALNLSAIKTLGCNQTAAYEGGFLVFNITLLGVGFSLGIGVKADKFVHFLSSLAAANWEAYTDSKRLAEELRALDHKFIERLENSKSSYELFSFYIFLYFYNMAIGQGGLNHLFAGLSEEDRSYFSENIQRNTIDQLLPNDQGTGAKIPRLLAAVAKNLVKVDPFFFADELRYPSLRRVFEKMIAELPKEEFPVANMMLSKLISAFSGCDSISYSVSPLSYSAGIQFTEVSYLHTTNPKLTIAGDSRFNSEKIILYPRSLTDIFNPFKYGEAFIKAVERNVLNLTAVSSHDLMLVSNPTPGFKLTDFSAGDLAYHMGVEEIGPALFIANSANLLNPKYIYDNCISPGLDATARVLGAVRKVFDKSEK